jgi:hypothetical protein
MLSLALADAALTGLLDSATNVETREKINTSRHGFRVFIVLNFLSALALAYLHRGSATSTCLRGSLPLQTFGQILCQLLLVVHNQMSFV